MADLNQPLSDAEYDRLALLLARGAGAMNLEMLDGFFVALICSPDVVRPSGYLRVIWGGDRVGGEAGFRDDEEMQEFFDLTMRHWNHVAGTLRSGETFLPLLLEDDAGVACANDWSQGFMRGTALRPEDWAGLLDDEEHGGLSAPFSRSRTSTIPIRRCAPTRSPCRRSDVCNWSLGWRRPCPRSIAILLCVADCRHEPSGTPIMRPTTAGRLLPRPPTLLHLINAAAPPRMARLPVRAALVKEAQAAVAP